VVDRYVEPFRVTAAKKGLQLVLELPDSIPDRFTGTGAGLQKVIARQLIDIIRVTPKGFIILRVKSEKAHDGRARIRFLSDAASSYGKRKILAELQPERAFAAYHPSEEQQPIHIGSIHSMVQA
jgi:hypothetical protein